MDSDLRKMLCILCDGIKRLEMAVQARDTEDLLYYLEQAKTRRARVEDWLIASTPLALSLQNKLADDLPKTPP